MRTTAILWFGGLVAVAPLCVASAAIVCREGSAHAEFTPGVTLKSQTVQFKSTGTLASCSSFESPEITAGAFRIEGSGTGACPGPFAEGSGKVTIDWNTREKSAVTVSFKAEATATSIDGVIQEGKFQGCKLLIVGMSIASATELGEQCGNSGLTTYPWAVGQMTIDCE